MTDDRLRCRCPAGCSERATQEDGLCDTCRFKKAVGIDPFPGATEASVIVARTKCIHLREPGSEPGARSAPIPFTILGGSP